MPTYMTITHDSSTIDIMFNDLESNPSVAMKRWLMRRGFIVDIQHYEDGSILITTDRGQTHLICAANDMIAGALPVTSINTVEPTDNNHLINLVHDLL